MLLKYLSLLRVHQYIKNFFVFAPLFFAFNFKINLLLNSLVAFGLFSLMASSVYIFNDLMDLKEDQKHPTKKKRPLPSGNVGFAKAILLMIGLSFFSLIFSLSINLDLFYVLVLYFLLNILYSIKLKHFSIIDISIIAIGFVLRLFAGSTVTNIPLSQWIIIITFLLSLFLAIAKRKEDILLALSGTNTRKNINKYNIDFVNAMMILLSAIIILSYIMYTISDRVVERLQSKYLYLTSLFVILGITRYMQISFGEEKVHDPTKILLKDKFLQFTILLWLLSFLSIVIIP